jgi:glycogen synthase
MSQEVGAGWGKSGGLGDVEGGAAGEYLTSGCCIKMLIQGYRRPVGSGLEGKEEQLVRNFSE